MAVQSDYRYTLDAGEKHTFDVISFKLTEGLSEPFRLELMLSSFDPNISFSALMDQMCIRDRHYCRQTNP